MGTSRAAWASTSVTAANQRPRRVSDDPPSLESHTGTSFGTRAKRVHAMAIGRALPPHLRDRRSRRPYSGSTDRVCNRRRLPSASPSVGGGRASSYRASDSGGQVRCAPELDDRWRVLAGRSLDQAVVRFTDVRSRTGRRLVQCRPGFAGAQSLTSSASVCVAPTHPVERRWGCSGLWTRRRGT